MAKRQKAKKMASRGASPKEIRKATGVKAPAARAIVQRAASRAPSPAPQPARQNTNKNQGGGVKAAIRQAGQGGISKGELRQISKDTGASGSKVIEKLDKVNQNLKSKDKTGISLNSGAANMLIKKAQKATPKSLGYQPVSFGSGRIGSTLMDMIGTPGSPGSMIKGQRVGARDAVAPELMIGGTAIRPGGRQTVRGFGKQFQGGPNTSPLPNDPPQTDPIPTDGEITPTPIDPILPPEEEEPTDPMIGMMAGGGMGAAGANKLGRARSRVRRLGIQGRGTGLLGRGLQYGNALN